MNKVPTPRRDIPIKKVKPNVAIPNECYLTYEARVLAFNENGESKLIAQGKDMSVCLDCLDRSINCAKRHADYLPQDTEAEVRVYLDIIEHRVYHDNDFPESHIYRPSGPCQIVWSSRDQGFSNA